jgi:hypothetical protein
MAEIEVQFESTKDRRWDLLNDLFESDTQQEGMKKDLPGGGTITLMPIPLRKSADPVSVITVVLAVPATIASIVQIAEYLSKKSKANKVTKIWLNRKEAETTPEGLTRTIETTLSLEQDTTERSDQANGK